MVSPTSSKKMALQRDTNIKRRTDEIINRRKAAFKKDRKIAEIKARDNAIKLLSVQTNNIKRTLRSLESRHKTSKVLKNEEIQNLLKLRSNSIQNMKKIAQIYISKIEHHPTAKYSAYKDELYYETHRMAKKCNQLLYKNIVERAQPILNKINSISSLIQKKRDTLQNEELKNLFENINTLLDDLIFEITERNNTYGNIETINAKISELKEKKLEFAAFKKNIRWEKTLDRLKKAYAFALSSAQLLRELKNSENKKMLPGKIEEFKQKISANRALIERILNKDQLDPILRKEYQFYDVKLKKLYDSF